MTLLARPRGLAALAAGALPLLAVAPRADAARPTCHGFPVTTTKSSGLVIGTAKRDVIRLTGPGRVRSGKGADIICGSRFKDVIESGPGDDIVLAGRGHDVVKAGAGRDHVYGEGGNDRLHGGPDLDLLHGGAGRNYIHGATWARSREQGLLAPAPSGDQVVPGTFALSIATDAQSVQALWQTGGAFVTSWVPPGTQFATLPVAWQVAQPLQVTMVGVGQGVAAFWTAGGPLAPGASVQPRQVQNANWGQQLSVGPFGFDGGSTGGPAGLVGVMNQAGQDIQAGVMIPGSVNGAQSLGIGTVAQLWQEMFLQLARPTRLRVQVSDMETRPGDVLGPEAIGPQATVTFTPSSPTATLRYTAAGGFTTG